MTEPGPLRLTEGPPGWQVEWHTEEASLQCLAPMVPSVDHARDFHLNQGFFVFFLV